MPCSHTRVIAHIILKQAPKPDAEFWGEACRSDEAEIIKDKCFSLREGKALSEWGPHVSTSTGKALQLDIGAIQLIPDYKS